MEFESIDGATALDPDEAADLIPTHISTLAQLNEWEQTNILAAQQWALRSARKDDVLTDEYIRELHRRMFDETWLWAGHYRKTGKNIGAPWHLIPVKVREACNDARYWVENELFAPAEIAVRLHHRMVSIHPFPNGNGRHTRLLADTLLVRLGERPLTWGRGNLQATGPARQAYLHALRAADEGDYSALFDFALS